MHLPHTSHAIHCHAWIRQAHGTLASRHSKKSIPQRSTELCHTADIQLSVFLLLLFFFFYKIGGAKAPTDYILSKQKVEQMNNKRKEKLRPITKSSDRL